MAGTEFDTDGFNHMSASDISQTVASSNVASELSQILNTSLPSLAPSTAPKSISYSPSTRSVTNTNILPCAGEPSLAQAEEYFVIFKLKMLHCFPVIYLSTDMSSHQLREERPFLWLCIMAVACKSTSQQVMLGDSIKTIVAQEILFHGEKRLEFLQGLLIFSAWSVSPQEFGFRS
jgi:hypothetical protein